MKRIFSAEFLPEVVHVRNLLEQAGIRCTLRNERLGGATGDIPFLESWPELWVADEQEARATSLLADIRAAPAEPGPAWQCASCGETIDGQFGECWNCGSVPTAQGQA